MIPNTRVIAVCSNQIGRAGNVAHVVGQLIGDGNGEVDGSVMRDQFELVIDIGLAICAVARVDGSAASLKVTGSVAVRLCTRGHLDQFFGRVARDGVLVLSRSTIGFVLEVDGLPFAKSFVIAERVVLGDLNSIDLSAGIAVLLEYQLEGLDVRIELICRKAAI